MLPLEEIVQIDDFYEDLAGFLVMIAHMDLAEQPKEIAKRAAALVAEYGTQALALRAMMTEPVHQAFPVFAYCIDRVFYAYDAMCQDFNPPPEGATAQELRRQAEDTLYGVLLLYEADWDIQNYQDTEESPWMVGLDLA